ncbi:DUF4382 domain-containing protein [Proteiniphilum sp. UBA1028]|uniref:DUF4382 domain-containing protein n=1 Tax=Proteiniphilum sp. UBA1028 TaxID=1947251 RepID=UPI0026009719|nr:DUF4382 domain-containing protein [Proteiniphilum sp. UBA1028]
MKTNFFKNGFLAVASLLMLWGVVRCTSENEKLTDGKATIQFKLTDAPALEYDEVNIDIRGVRVGVANDFFYVDDEGDVDSSMVTWVDLDIPNPGIYNLLDFRNGETVLLANGDIPAGKISQVRLILGNQSNVVVNGMAHDLKTPSAQTSGLKFNLHETLVPDMAYSFVIDFDASRSVIKRGNGTYLLKPVIRTYADAFGGTIKGIALPAREDTVGVSYVQIISGEDTLISLPEENGLFLFPGLKPALWNLTVFADTTSTYRDTVINDIEVKVGEVVDLGIIQLKND